MLTGNKDVDRKILNELRDEDLVNVCQTNKKVQSICNNQVFWMNRVFLKYPDVPGDVLRANKDKYWSSWSEYYIKDLRKINSINGHQYLMNGSASGRLDHVIISLMGHGANTNNDYALRLASQGGHLDIVKYLINAGADIHGNDDFALRWASNNGHLEVVKYLVELKPDGAKIHAFDDYALRYSSRNGHLDIVKYLVELKPDGANIHANDDGALGWASINGHLEIVRYLKNII